MQLKDYYSILELSPSATTDEVKKAYRRLAQLYHPDKKRDDPYAAARFSEIKEAYETLSNPSRKEHYLQQRWYLRSQGKSFSHETITPVSLLKAMLDFDRYVSTLDSHRLYRQGLYDQFCLLLSDENIRTLNHFGEFDINMEIVRLALKTGRHLPFRYSGQVADRISMIDAGEGASALIDRFLTQHRRSRRWEKYKVWLVALIVLLICLVIFFSSK